MEKHLRNQATMCNNHMEYEIMPRDNGFTVKNTDKSLFLSRPELLNIGCKNCIWKLNDQCPHGLSDSGFLPEGYCKEIVSWLFSLSGSSDSSTVIWERYHIFVSQLQASEDYKEFKRLDKEIKLMEADNPDRHDLTELEMKKNNLKLWWVRLNDSILKSLSKTADRESRSENVEKMTKVIGISDFNKILQGNIESDEPIPVEYKEVLEDEN